MTNNRKLLSILYNYGCSISYNVAEELETEVTSYEDEQYLLPDIKEVNNLCTNVALDHYDRYVENINGKDTLHDTCQQTMYKISQVLLKHK